MRRAAVAVAVLVSGAVSLAPASGQMCGTPSPTPEQARAFQQALTLRSPEKVIAGPVPIPVAFHAIHDGRNGKISADRIAVLVHNLNVAFQGTPFSFWLYKTTSTKNKVWYRNCDRGTANEQKMKNKLAVDTRYVLNIYSCQSPQFGNYARFPFEAANGHKIHGVVMNPGTVPGGTWDGRYWPYGLVAAHETGHYLGLFHTFETAANPGTLACTDPGDFVDDTPAQTGPHWSCDPADTCPALPGNDDILNFMNYTTGDDCWDHFTPGQVERMEQAVEMFRPTLLP